MSLKTKTLKEVRRKVERLKDEAREQVAIEILILPFWYRLKLAWRIVWRSKKMLDKAG